MKYASTHQISSQKRCQTTLYTVSLWIPLFSQSRSTLNEMLVMERSVIGCGTFLVHNDSEDRPQYLTSSFERLCKGCGHRSYFTCRSSNDNGKLHSVLENSSKEFGVNIGLCPLTKDKCRVTDRSSQKIGKNQCEQHNLLSLEALVTVGWLLKW